MSSFYTSSSSKLHDLSSLVDLAELERWILFYFCQVSGSGEPCGWSSGVYVRVWIDSRSFRDEDNGVLHLAWVSLASLRTIAHSQGFHHWLVVRLLCTHVVDRRAHSTARRCSHRVPPRSCKSLGCQGVPNLLPSCCCCYSSMPTTHWSPADRWCDVMPIRFVWKKLWTIISYGGRDEVIPLVVVVVNKILESHRNSSLFLSLFSFRWATKWILRTWWSCARFWTRKTSPGDWQWLFAWEQKSFVRSYPFWSELCGRQVALWLGSATQCMAIPSRHLPESRLALSTPSLYALRTLRSHHSVHSS